MLRFKSFLKFLSTHLEYNGYAKKTDKVIRLNDFIKSHRMGRWIVSKKGLDCCQASGLPSGFNAIKRATTRDCPYEPDCRHASVSILSKILQYPSSVQRIREKKRIKSFT